MRVGVITKAGDRVPWKEAVRRAREIGHLDGYSYETVYMMAKGSQRRDELIPVSMMFNRGMRKSILERLIDHYTPLKSVYMLTRGTLIHASRETIVIPNDPILREIELTAKLPSGLVVCGHPDKFNKTRCAVTDFKTTSSKSSSWPITMHVGQISAYGWLLEKNGYIVRHLELDYLSWWGEQVIRVTPWNRKGLLTYMERRGRAVRAAFDHDVVPDERYCSDTLCRYCRLRDVCKSNPGEFTVTAEHREEA